MYDLVNNVRITKKMANLTVTPGNVALTSTNVSLISIQLGETITAGQPLYRADSGKYMIGEAAIDAPTAAIRGIAYTGGNLDDFAQLIVGGKFNPGATLVAFELYVLSTETGMIMPLGDLATGDYFTPLFYALTTSEALCCFAPTGIQK